MNELIKVDAVTEDLKRIPAQIESHREIATKAELVASSIKQAVETNGGEMTADLDQRAQKFLALCNTRRKEMEESRKPLTQVLDAIKKQFTEQESKLDPAKGGFAKEIQDFRDAYARAVFEKQEQQRREAEEKAKAEKAKADARIKLESLLNSIFDNALITKKSAINSSFAAITLETFEKKAEGLKNMPIRPSHDAIDKLLEEYKQRGTLLETGLSASEQFAILKDVMTAFDVNTWTAKFIAQIQLLKDELIDKLPSKKAELDALAAADEDERRRMEKIRQQEIQDMEAKAQQEKADAEKRAKELEEQKQAAAAAEIMFEQTIAATPMDEAPEARTGFDIHVLHPAGWAEIFQVWFSKKGAMMNVEDIGKTKLETMKTFVEKLAKDEGFRIESKFLKYETAVKAINRKK